MNRPFRQGLPVVRSDALKGFADRMAAGFSLVQYRGRGRAVTCFSVMERLLLTLAIIFVSLFAGYAIRQWVGAGRASFSGRELDRLRLFIQKVAMFGLIPVSAMLSLWGLPSPDVRLLALPALGLAAWIAGGVLALLFARQMHLGPAQTGSFYCCGTFTNIGAVGTLVAVMYFGEQAIAMASLYRLCEELFFFSVALPVARRFSTRPGQGNMRRFRLDPVLVAIVLALALGLLLNIAGIPRPAVLGKVSTAAMLAGTVCFLLSIGMGLRISRMTAYVREAAVISLIKFLLVPGLVTSLAMLAGLGELDGGVPLKVVVILSAMPVAMNALIPPSLFGLDLDLANACWVFTTLELVVVLPIIIIILPLL